MATPTSATSQPPSYKTNVNRAKTKRWVEAKSYSYDGDDWGDLDDYDEYPGYDEPEPAPAPKPTGLRQQGQSSSQPAEGRYDQDIYQSPISLEGASFPPHGAPSLQQQLGARHVTNPTAQPPMPSSQRGSFEHGDNRRAFSAGQVHTTPEMQPNPASQQSRSIGTYDFQPELKPTPGQSLPGPWRGSGQSPNRQGAAPQLSSVEPPHPDGGHSGFPKIPGQSRIDQATSSAISDQRKYSSSAMPLPLNTRNPPSPRSDPQHPPRKSSIGQQSQSSFQVESQAPPLPPAAPTARERTGSSSSTRGLPFIRPADIYRRMEEERERERQSQESARPSMDVIVGRPKELPSDEREADPEPGQSLKPTREPLTERKSEHSVEGPHLGSEIPEESNHSRVEKQRTTSKTFEISKTLQHPASQSATLSPELSLPDPTRMSGFGEGFSESFMRSPDSHGHKSHGQPDRPSESSATTASQSGRQEPNVTNLRHQPSKGFTSAVHQAFDTAQDQVPPTPGSMADSSIARSSSGGTNAVSPIMSRGPSAVDRDKVQELPSIDDVTTPTQETDALNTQSRKRASGSFATITQITQQHTSHDTFNEPPPPGFKVGHRRHSGTPSPDNSPAKTPILATMSHLRHPQEADYAQTTPTPTESVPSTSGSLREPAPPASPTKAFLSQRTDSSGSGRVKNLAEKFENTSRPESAQSNTTPRASVVIGPPTSDVGTQESTRPSNARVESFRPHLPGGWQSSASIQPSTAPERRETPNEIDTSNKPPSRFADALQVHPSRGAFSAAADAGSALASAITVAAGLHNGNAKTVSSDGRRLNDHSPTDYDRPSPLPKDTPRPIKRDSERSDYFTSPAQDQESFSSVFPAKQPSSLPPLSTTSSIGEYESDRLRREIVRELDHEMCSDPTTAASDSPKQPSSRYPTNDSLKSTGQQGSDLPSEYDSYWDDDSEDGTVAKSPTTSNAGLIPISQPLSQSGNEATSPDLTRRFSWEQPLADISTSGKPKHIPAQHAGIDAPSAPKPEAQKPDLQADHTVPQDTSSPEVTPQESYHEHHAQGYGYPDAPRLTIDTLQNQSSAGVELVKDSAGVAQSREGVSQVVADQPTTPKDMLESHKTPSFGEPSPNLPTEAGATSVLQQPSSSSHREQLLPPPALSSNMPKLPAFREIMSLKSPQERIRTFTDIQTQFANMNTGLEHWLAVTINDLPEHGDLVGSGGRSGLQGPGHKASPSGSKPGQPYYQQYLNASSQPSYTTPTTSTSGSAPQAASPSAASGGKKSSQQVQAKGKEFLHSAGVFGGKANVAAKGLFSKGKSKLRDASGSKKAYLSNPTASGARGMQSQHATPKSRTPIRNSQALQPHEVESEDNTPSVQSTHSQLADDERSVESSAEKHDRLPRSSKIFRKRDTSEKRKSKSQGTSVVASDGDSATPVQHRPTPTSEPSMERIQADRLSSALYPIESAGVLEAEAVEPGLYDADGSGVVRHEASSELQGIRRASPDSSTPGESSLPIQLQDDQRGSGQGLDPRPKSVLESNHVPPATLRSSSVWSDHAMSRATSEVAENRSIPIRDHDKLRLPSQNPSMEEPSIESLTSPLDLHRPPSPISPELPIQPISSSRGRHMEPIHHGIEHNFLPEGDIEAQRRRSQSYSRPFKPSESRSQSRGSQANPHAVRRPSAEELAMPVGFYQSSITREEALIPRRQAPEYSIEGVGPPDLPPKDSKTQSRRGSRSSAFFKSLTRTFTDSDSPSMPHSMGDRVDDSPAASSTKLDSKSKRSSIFGLPRSRTDLSINNGKVAHESSRRPGISRDSSNLTQLPAPIPPPKSAAEDDDEFPMRPKQRTSSGLSRKFHRSNTSVSKVPESNKKNRFSRLGSIFGKANQRPTATAEQFEHPSFPRAREHSQTLPIMPKTTNYQAVSASPQQQTPYEYYTPKAPPASEPPSLEGCYGPRHSSTQRPSGLRKASTSAPNTQNLPTSPTDSVPAYIQDATARQPTSPPANKGGKSSRASFDLFRKASQVSQSEHTAATQTQKSKGSAWNRFSRQASPRNLGLASTSPQPTPPITFQGNSISPPTSSLPTEQVIGHDIDRYDSPPPPPPPPKDDWHRATPRRSSLAAITNRYEQQTPATPPLNASPLHHRPFQGLPPLQTNDIDIGPIKSGFTSPPTDSPAKFGMTYEEKRRSRQWEIEQGHMRPRSAGISPREKRRSQIEQGPMTNKSEDMTHEEKRRSKQMQIETGHLNYRSGEGFSAITRSMTGGPKEVKEGRAEGEDDIRMSATSFPGQEWRPLDQEYAWGNQ